MRSPVRVLVFAVSAILVAAGIFAVTRCAPDGPSATSDPAPREREAPSSATAPPGETPAPVRRTQRARAVTQESPASAEPPPPARTAEEYDFPEIDVAGELPESALGKGPCVLRLALVDDATGEPVAARARLWRLGVPEDGRWKDGDHVQRRADVPKEGLVWNELPAGRYLLQVDAQRRGADPIPEVVLSGSHELTARLALPRPVVVRALVFDAAGRTIERCAMSVAARWARTHRPEPPEGVTPREPLRKLAQLSVMMSGRPSGAFLSTLGARRAPEILCGPDGFELGTVAEATREATPRASFRLRFEGLCSVEVDATAEEASAGIYVALAEPVEPLAAGVRLPDGRTAAEAGASVTATCSARLRRPTDRADLWREAVVTVLVQLDGWKVLSFEHRLGEPPPDLTMERVEPK